MEVNGRWFSIHWSYVFLQKEHWFGFQKKNLYWGWNLWQVEMMPQLWQDRCTTPGVQNGGLRTSTSFNAFQGVFLNPGFNKWQVFKWTDLIHLRKIPLPISCPKLVAVSFCQNFNISLKQDACNYIKKKHVLILPPPPPVILLRFWSEQHPTTSLSFEWGLALSDTSPLVLICWPSSSWQVFGEYEALFALLGGSSQLVSG